ncbi:AAA family ATPase [Azonexus hydrophilus]|uniref:AAA family ATPase n=1 Tax=Azonexus hydrophilus TaxID=418702 RepID=A0A1R1I4W4_9RHOO|nr:AAA family ATPase [Azonexus hydrophilus]OMG53755.1 AAA family ATPase [Azonexus hydrophilus]
MYLDHFGLNELPFGITPDTAFTVLTRGHQEALNTLLVALGSGEGFIKITGEVGSGKSLLCRRLLQSLQGDVVSAYLPNPYLAPRTLFLALAEELGLSIASSDDDYHVLKQLNTGLLDFAAAGYQVVVCIDEAQAMPLETLESLRLLSNLETEKRKLLQIVLFGQPELDRKLAEPSVRQLRQRIAFHYELPGLGHEEVATYLVHRLRVAGYRGEGIFGKRAVRCLHRASRGTPRLLNILAHKSLLATFGDGRHLVRASHVRRAAADTEGASAPGWW